MTIVRKNWCILGALFLPLTALGHHSTSVAFDTSVVTEVDRAIEAHILGAILDAYPGHATCAEESASASDPGRADAQYCWVVDPIDGTRNYVSGFPSYSTSIAVLERGETPPALHFAQVNERDGFFLTGRDPDPDFSWDKLAGKKVLVDHGIQPMAMFRYACHKAGIDYGAIEAIDAGSGAEMDAAFRAGTGDYIHREVWLEFFLDWA